MESGNQPWRLELFGGMRLVRGEQVVTHFRTRKNAALLAYLACHPDREHPRELLADLLWPERDPAAARHSLNVALAYLRQRLEAPDLPKGAALGSSRMAVRLDPQWVTTDVAEFQEALSRAA